MERVDRKPESLVVKLNLTTSRSAWSAWIERDSSNPAAVSQIVALRMERVDRKLLPRLYRTSKVSSRSAWSAWIERTTMSAAVPETCGRAPHGARGSKAHIVRARENIRQVALRMERVDRKFFNISL